MADPHEIFASPTGIGATALGVALLRAREGRRNDRLFYDPYAQAFVDHAGPDQPILRRIGSGPDLFQLIGEQVAVRTHFLDQALLKSARAGHSQIVLLACGMDTRAFRLGWPDGTTVYEADQPEVLTFKNTVLDHHRAELPPPLNQRRPPHQLARRPDRRWVPTR